jgi:hypothetical protein
MNSLLLTVAGNLPLAAGCKPLGQPRRPSETGSLR